MTREETIKILEELLWHLRVCPAKSANDYRNALREAMKMLSQKGRWVELPCEIGETVYVIEEEMGLMSIEERKFDLDMLCLMGTYAFLTEEEAEKELAAMEGE